MSSPPVTSIWYDPQVTKDNVLAILRLTASDVDVPRIEQSIPAAALAIEQEVDRAEPLPGPPAPEALQTILDAVTVNVYHSLAWLATIGAGGAAAPLPRGEPFDPVREVRAQLLPFKQRWGLA